MSGRPYPDAFAADQAAFLAGLPPAWRTEPRALGLISWRTCQPPELELPAQGWKLHVSASVVEATELIRVVLPELIDYGVAFKLPASLNDIIAVNSGALGATQVGKIVTVYPPSDGLLASLVRHLARIWRPRFAPPVASDIPVSTDGGLWLRYGAFDATNIIVSAVGAMDVAIRTPEGRLVPDERAGDGSQPAWAPPPPVAPSPRAGVADLTEAVNVSGSRYLRLKRLAEKVGSRLDLALRIEDCQLVVLRSAVRGAGCDPLGNDAVDRLENEHAVLSTLGGAARCASLIAFDRANHFLVTEDVEGVMFTELDKTQRLARLPELADAVAKLHEFGFVHRDLKLSNVRGTSAGVRLIDLELAARPGTRRPLHAGTDGYVGPEGRHADPEPSYDVYSLGACITHACIGVSPSHFPLSNIAGRQVSLLELSGQHAAAQIVRAALRLEPAERPSARGLSATLTASMPTLLAQGERRPAVRHPARNRRWAATAAVDAGSRARSFRRPSGGWASVRLHETVETESINMGAAGTVIGLVSIDAALGMSHCARDAIGGAEWLASRPPTEHAHGLFTGNAGVAVALAVAGRRYRRSQLLEASRQRFALAASSSEPDFDLFSGAAGILWAGCLLHAVLGERWVLDAVRVHAERIVDTVCSSEDVLGWPSSPAFDATRSVYLGAAHGTAGVALALASWGAESGCQRSADLAVGAFTSVWRHGLTNDRANILATTSGTTQAPHHWCHGVAGYLWCLLQAPEAMSRTRHAVAWATEAFLQSVPFVDNATMCHGLAGVLDTARVLSRRPGCARAAHRTANQVVAVLRALHDYRGDGITWSSEQTQPISPVLWVGFLGPASQLAMAATGITHPLLSREWLKRSASATGRRQALQQPAPP